ncbi:oxygenase MpaB family protein [Nocardia asteroides]|uniref:oxygenase MpaB family protein n=1 Tax=Nocardia asteroides TaxID=1824 RepID=UPI0037CB57F2
MHVSSLVNPSSSATPLARGAERKAVLEELKDIVSRDEFRDRLAVARSGIDDPSYGFFGPESTTWKIVKPMPIVMMMQFWAGILEVFEPRITAGFSAARTPAGGEVTAKIRQDTEPGPRFARSYEAFMDWYVGDDETATRTSNRIFGYHSRIVTRMPDDATGSRYTPGTAYSALEPELMVFAVLTQAVPLRQLYERYYGPLSFSESLKYNEEVLRFAGMVGADPELMPKTWDEMQQWLDNYYRDPDGIRVDEEFLEAVLAIFSSRAVAVVVLNWVGLSMPPALAERLLALPQLQKYRRVARLIDPILRAVFRMAPDALMTSVRWRDAMQRVGRKGWTRPARLVAKQLPRPWGTGQRNLSDINLSASPRMKATLKADRFLADSDELLDAAAAGGCPMTPAIRQK